MKDDESISNELSALINALASHLSGTDVAAASGGMDPQDLARECLRTISSSGFELRASPLLSSSEVQSNSAVAAVEELQNASKLRLRDLLNLWRQFSGPDAEGPANLYAQIGQRVLKSGEPLLAYDILQVGLRHWPTDVRLRQLLALSLARSGAPAAAAKRLEKLVDEGHQDEETLGLLARTRKDAWEAELDLSKREEHLRESYRLYRKGFDHALATDSADGAIYAGINAATTALLLNEAETAAAIAKQVAPICRSKPDCESDYWAMATLGECDLIMGRLEDAAAHYCAAVKLAGSNYADIASTRRNAAILLDHLKIDAEVLTEWFPIPSVAIFTGHLIDRPGSETRFPHERIDSVRSQINACLAENRVGFGYSAAASGGDLLFLGAIEQRDAESHIVLPLGKELFVQLSVAGDPNHDWEKEFEQAMDRAAHVMVVNDFSRTDDPLQFEYANQVMTGLAMLHARSLGAKIIPIAVWDGKPARGPGGTGSLVETWRQMGWTPHVINPLHVPDKSAASTANSVSVSDEVSESSSSSSRVVRKEIRAMLFADVVGYSKITEEEIPLFIDEFMSRIAACVAASGIKLETWNTWGDAIFFVFRNVEEAGLTALQITELVNSIDWKTHGFERQLNLRTGLHVGPVYRLIDPITRMWTHTGAHVSRAARIEPIAPPGEVYASEAFAAVAAAENVTSFRCNYVGVTPMAKGYGDFPTYHVRRAKT
ncbi:tetratricopeptide repeat-containing protein [Novipirellula sp. SH528]|uniref:tetratricopeptide repeat-containing protein n=1 Tax=Novipirellula sp. SH528 TaxID=3454466 RepID=UPI003F9EEBA4